MNGSWWFEKPVFGFTHIFSPGLVGNHFYVYKLLFSPGSKMVSLASFFNKTICPR